MKSGLRILGISVGITGFFGLAMIVTWGKVAIYVGIAVFLYWLSDAAYDGVGWGLGAPIRIVAFISAIYAALRALAAAIGTVLALIGAVVGLFGAAKDDG